jgi:hypothetical protein
MWTRRGPMLLATAWSLKTGKRHCLADIGSSRVASGNVGEPGKVLDVLRSTRSSSSSLSASAGRTAAGFVRIHGELRGLGSASRRARSAGSLEATVSEQLRAVDRPGRSSSPSKLAKPIRFLAHDRDKRFGACFDEVLNAEGIEIVRTRPAVTGARSWGRRGQSRRG